MEAVGRWGRGAQRAEGVWAHIGNLFKTLAARVVEAVVRAVGAGRRGFGHPLEAVGGGGGVGAVRAVGGGGRRGFGHTHRKPFNTRPGWWGRWGGGVGAVRTVGAWAHIGSL